MAYSENLKTLIRTRASIKGNITRLLTFFNANPEVEIDEIEIRKTKLEEAYTSFLNIQIQIETLADTEKISDMNHELERTQFDEQYFSCAKIINSHLRKINQASVSNQTPVSNHAVASSSKPSVPIQAPITIKQANNILPKIEIRPFDGNPINWYSFHDSFKNLVHDNADIIPVHKFYLLQNSLQGSLRSITENLNASEENYDVAWDTLKKRCNKPRQIIQTHLKLLLELPEIHRETPANLRSLVEKAQVHVNALKALEQPIEHWDTLLVFIIVKKLDSGTRRAWERTLENEDMPKFKELITFLTKQARGDEMDIKTYDSRNNKSGTSNSNMHKKHSYQGQTYLNTEVRKQCPLCNNNHAIYTCSNFLKLNQKARYEAAKRSKLCLNCLRNNHTTQNCYAESCKKCNRKHHTLLHFSNSQNTNSQTAESNTSLTNQNHNSQPLTISNQDSEASINLSVTCSSEVLLGTASIKILDKHENEVPCRVLLDSGSQTHFITETLAERLMLDKTKINLPFAGLGQTLTNSRYTVKTYIKSRITLFSKELTFVALPTIAGILPVKAINKSSLSIPKNIPLADPDFYKPAEIDALLGSELFYQLLSIGQIKLDNNSVILQKTQLGWIVTGKVNTIINNPNTSSCFLTTSLETQLNKFWEIEEITSKKHYSKEELACEAHFTKNTRFDHYSGRYTVRLPFNDKKCMLGDSYKTALKRLYSLEKRFETNLDLKSQYGEFLKEYQSLNHMVDITDTDNKQLGFYLPHHAVIKEASVSTKVRVVFDGSAKTSTGVSLNDTLMQGPVIQDDLISIILRFREYDIVFAADIEKMFRQILVDPEDAIFQKILWRDEVDQTVKTYMLRTVTYGTTSASFQAIRCLKQLAHDYGKNYPLAATVLEKDFYVDDLLTGTNDIQEAQLLIEQLIDLLKLGGFNLRQWISNEPSLLENIKSINNSSPTKLICLNDIESKKVLGIQWDPHCDLIKYTINLLSKNNTISKRTILSEIAQLFDPLGLLGPVIIKAKLIMQELWKANLTWDESVPQYLYTEWINFKKQLNSLNDFSIKRIIKLKNAVEVQLHGFCDASEKAYGACIYIRSTDNNNKTFINLMCAKSRVAPLKTISLPRLELCAAKLLANLFNSVVKSSNLNFQKINFYSDSTIALNWINTPPYQLKTFEANRVSEIQTLAKGGTWYHISTFDNTADYISRGQSPGDFMQNKMWLTGPQWLLGNESHWKIMKLAPYTGENNSNISMHAAQNVVIKNTEFKKFLERFSSIRSLNRFAAICYRFIHNKKSNANLSGELSASELQDAHFKIIKLVQEQEFSHEIHCIKLGKELNHKSNLLRLNPFIDNLGILRVGGRLTNAKVSYSKKYPILLPRSNHITDLIIRDTHIINWHTGVQNTLNLVRERYWPIDGKNRTRYIIHKCIRCFKNNPKLPDYTMGNLPKGRLIQTRPFENAGLDYCGPFLIKEKKFRNKVTIKAYVVVFVCFTTKAIHLELVTDLSTETCLAAIKRFFSRRGISKNLYSDNATNFIGAKNEMLRVNALLLSEQHNKKLMHDLATEGVNWHFIPPRSPHFGGLWEAGVKQFKNHLLRSVGKSLFTYEQLNTFIIEIEAILNSRPLTPLSSDPNDFSSLTPAHFLIGDSLKSLPESDMQHVPNNRLTLWQHIEKVKQDFWKRWHKDYFNELHLRKKWYKNGVDQIKEGTLVMVKEDNTSPLHWPMGRIIQVHPGEDSVVRVATIRTSSGTYKRCVKRLCPLPIDVLTN